MFLVKVENVKMEINDTLLFENACLEIKARERVALIGENGVGKTTLLKGLLGKSPISEGNIIINLKPSEIGWMLQETDILGKMQIREWIESHDQEKSFLKKELNRYMEMLDQSSSEEILDKYQQLFQKYLDVSGYEWEAEVEKTMSRVGLPEDVWNSPLCELSGGQKTRAKLARAIIQSPKLLILDEPTNHLDFETIEWLQEWMKRFKSSILFISHERSFIDQLAMVTYELTEKGTKKYVGGYSEFKVQKEHEFKTNQALFEKQENERKKLMETIQTYKNWFQSATATASVRNPYAQKQASKQAVKYKAKEKALERLENNRIEKPSDSKSIQARFDMADFSARRMINISKVAFDYGHQPVFANVDFQVNRGDRLAVAGKNGSGKTTLLKLMAGELSPTSGSITLHPQLKIGHFFQELENLNQENSILDELLLLPNMTQTEARTILACFLFRKEEVYKKIEHLSMGEKCRVAFVKLYFSDANLLVLDEPTNYLDISTRERIEDALAAYPGSVVVVGHDPYLLRKVANKVVMIEEGKATYFSGSYREWEQHATISPIKQDLVNQQHLIELAILDILNQEMDQVEEESRFRKIKELKKQLEEVKNKIKNG